MSYRYAMGNTAPVPLVDRFMSAITGQPPPVRPTGPTSAEIEAARIKGEQIAQQARAAAAASQPSVWDRITQGLQIAGALRPQQVVAQPVSTTPSWLVPAAIGGVGLLVIVLVAKKK